MVIFLVVQVDVMDDVLARCLCILWELLNSREQRKKPELFSVQKGIMLSSYVGIIINHYKDPY